MSKKRRTQNPEYAYSEESALNSYGEVLPSIHEPVKREGHRFYSREGHNKEFYFLEGPEGEKPRRIELTPSVVGRNIWGYMNDLIKRGKLNV
jgi:hypothetical protein